jgi:protein involved in polysaccharide export with SLBB domain
VAAVTFGLAAALGGCGDPPPSEYPSQEVHVEDSRLGIGDKIAIRVFYGRGKEMNSEYTIDVHGGIAFPLLGDIEVLGLSRGELERTLQEQLSDGYLVNPVVSVDLMEVRSRQITILGQVASPGTLPYFEGMSIVEAISQAGGFTAMARKNSVRVTRHNGKEKKDYTVPVEAIAENRADRFLVRPGDVIFVPERRW